MASVDDIFKQSGVPSKRKLEPIKDPNEVYKASKLSANGTHRHAQVEDDAETDDATAGPADPDDEDYGPELPRPDGQDEDDGGDDEEGRFFGGGISKQESRILDYVDGADDEGSALAKIDVGWLRKTAVSFEKHISKNAELRAKFEGQPQKFIASEADLDADIKGLAVLAEHPALYAEFIRLGCVESLVGLLAHENTDISIDAIEVIGELTDEDVDALDDQWDALADALVEADLLGLLVSNLSRLNEDDESDRNGVYYALGIMESLCSRPAIAVRMGQEEKVLRWLLDRIQRKEATVSQNKQYAAEMLAILAQSSPENRRQLAELDAVDIMLQLVAAYRKRDPDKGGEEEEYMENLYEALTGLVDEPAGKAKMLEAEGVELCLITLKEGKMSRAPALRLLDHSAGGPTGGEVCQKLVEAGGLKTIFTLFVKTQDQRLVIHLLGLLASMLRLLPADSAERIRTLAKFVEKDYEKIAKLIRLRRDFSARVDRAEAENEQERKQASTSGGDTVEMELLLLSRKLDAGLYTLQLVDVILAWLVAEDGGAKARIKKLLAERDEDLGALRATITEQRGALDMGDEDSRDMGDMLGTLLEFLR